MKYIALITGLLILGGCKHYTPHAVPRVVVARETVPARRIGVDFVQRSLDNYQALRDNVFYPSSRKELSHEHKFQNLCRRTHWNCNLLHRHDQHGRNILDELNR